MATTSQNGINFNNYKPQTDDTVNMGQWPIVLAGQTGPDTDGGIINVVDIDWNGAVLPNGDIANGSSKTINTTGELLSLINSMSEQIITLNEQVYALGAAVIAIGSKVSN